MRKILIYIFLISASFMAKAYDNFFVFGDSLSDVGNVKCPLPLSFEHRWTDGKVWNEYLAEMLNIKVPCKSSNWQKGENIEKANINFAHASCKIKSRFYPVTSIEEQINGEWISRFREIKTSFLRYGTRFNPNDLVAIWGGANDYIMDICWGDEWIERTTTQSVNDQIANIKKLIELGAKNIIVINLPDIGQAPFIIFESDATEFSLAFNKKLSYGLAKLENAYKDVNFYKIDAAKVLYEIISNYKAYGFEFCTKSMAKDYLFGTLTDKSKYVFYDGLHPSTRVHKILADEIFKTLISKNNFGH